jgi:Tfp pilus assembly protein PilE
MQPTRPSNEGKPNEGIIPAKSRMAGFTLAELVIVVVVAAAVLAAAALGFQAIGNFKSRLGARTTIVFGSGDTMNSLYGTALSNYDVTVAPNHWQKAKAEFLRVKFLEDCQKAYAVYCLPRTNLSAIRPQSISFTSPFVLTNYDFRRVDTPEAFRTFLSAAVTGASNTFLSNAYASTGAAMGRNLSVFMVGPAGSSSMAVNCVYEVDFVRTSNPGGVFATVRRFAGSPGTQPTGEDYYDVFYPDIAGTTASASNFFVAASFLRAGVPTTTSPLTNAERRPFQFVWWPDPSSPELPTGTNYLNTMRDQTSFLMVVPTFPSL